MIHAANLEFFSVFPKYRTQLFADGSKKTDKSFDV
jgi:hypothetical protein